MMLHLGRVHILRVDENEVAIWGGPGRGTFPKPSEDINLKEGDSVLFYLSGDPPTQKIIAVDKIYEGERRFVVRVLGSLEEVPPAEEKGRANVEVWLTRLPVPRTAIKLRVVGVNQELLFKSGDLLFDWLSAQDEYFDGCLTVVREGEVFDQTSCIMESGGHASRPVFMGLRRAKSDEVSTFVPEDFEEGDVLILEIPPRDNFVFTEFLKIQHLQYSSCVSALRKKPSGTIGEFQPIFAEELQEKAREFLQNPSISILRWRSR